MNGPRAGLIYLGLAAGGIWLLVTGNLAKVQAYLTGAVTGTPAANQPTHAIQGPSFPRAGALDALAKARPGHAPIAS